MRNPGQGLVASYMLCPMPERVSRLQRAPWRAVLPALAALAACGGVVPPNLDATRPAGAAGPAPAPSLVSAAAPEATLPPPAPLPVPRAPLPTADCPLRWVPKKLQASVLVIPESYVGRFMIPAFDALCACSRPGDHLAITLRVSTGTGELSAATSPRSDPELSAHPAVDACLAGLLAARRFEPFDVPSDVVCDDGPSTSPDAGAPGPAGRAEGPVSFFRPPRRVGCGVSAGATIVYPLLVDRRNEAPVSP